MAAKSNSASEPATTEVSLTVQFFDWIETSVKADELALFSPQRAARIAAKRETARQLLEDYMAELKETNTIGTVESLPVFWRDLVLSRKSFPDVADYDASVRVVSAIHGVIAEFIKPYMKAALLSTKTPGLMCEYEREMKSLPCELGPNDKVDSLLAEATDLPPSLDDGNLQSVIARMRTWPPERSLVRALVLLGYLSRIGDPLAFRRWLERANPLLEAKTPAARLAEGAWAEIADQVDEMLTGFRQ